MAVLDVGNQQAHEHDAQGLAVLLGAGLHLRPEGWVDIAEQEIGHGRDYTLDTD